MACQLQSIYPSNTKRCTGREAQAALVVRYRELDDAIELTQMAGDVLADSRTGKNGRPGHATVGNARRASMIAAEWPCLGPGARRESSGVPS